ncbi:MAG: SDR family NAD(P)-dependent oxidoreductase, partial [Trebonia sp.]
MNRTVIVTGGSRGIGYSAAAGFAAAGDRVLITGRHREPIEAAAAVLGPGVTAAVCDASDPAEVEALQAALP